MWRSVDVGGRRQERVDEAGGVWRQRAARERVARVRGESGVNDARDVRARGQRARDREGVPALLLHAQVERLGAALGEPAVIGARDRADSVLKEGQAFVRRGAVGGEDQRSHDDIRVAVDIFS